MRDLLGRLRMLFTGKNYLVFSAVLLVLIGLPVSILVLRQQQTIQQKATAATTFAFNPSSSTQAPIRTSQNGIVSLDVMVNPGTNAIAAVKLELLYDPTKFSEITGTPIFTPDPATFPQVTEGPTVSPGKVVVGLSIGSDPTKAVTTITKIGTVKLKVTNTIGSTSTISFGSNSSATSITATGTTAGSNVLSGTSPAIITTQLITVTSAPTTVTFKPTDDTYVQGGSPTQSHGSSTTISVVGGSEVKTGYLRFDFTSLLGKNIQSAKLRIKVSNGSSGTQNFKSVANTSWSESTMTYNNRPSLGSVITTLGSTSDGQIKEIDLTAYVSANKGKFASLGVDSSSTNTFGFNSKEATSDKPTLTVVYTTETILTPTAVPTSKPPTATIKPPTGTPKPSIIISETLPTNTPPVGGSCSAVATDTVLIIDKSGSMKEELAQAKTAAKLYIDQVAKNSQNKVAVVVYDTNGALLIGLTNNFAAAKSAIDGIAIGSGTCIQCGIDKANAEIAANGRSGIKKVAVLLTDGRANKINGKSAATTDAEAAAIQSAKNGNAAKGTTFFTIGLGTNVNATFLQQLATFTGGTYSFSPTADQLAAIYQTISTIVGKGSITGTVFLDENNNGVKDSDEPPAVGWKVTLKTSTGAPIGTSTTNASGGYSFTSLCDGITYIVTLTQQTGFKQTLPANNGTYSLPITNGEAVENKDFGVWQIANPTERPLPTVDLTANPTTVTTGGSVTLTWKTSNADSCLAGGPETGWVGPKPASGTQVVGPVNVPENYIFTLTCTNPAGTGSDTAIVTVVGPTATNVPTATPTVVVTPTNSPTEKPEPTATPVPTVTLMPTPTTNPNATVLNFTVFLHSIGNSGDNVNPNAFSLSNKEPVHPQRQVKVSVYNASNQLVSSSSGLMTYQTDTGNFTGSVSLGQSFVGGSHIVTVQTESFLTNLFPGIQTITTGEENILPATTLVAGDVNGDNKLNILDYNILLGCYTSEDQPEPKNCTPNQKRLADLNDEGIVNRYDYNLFLRELSVQSGFSL